MSISTNDFCRLCQINMREAGTSVYGHSTDMFLTKTAPSISEKLALLGVTVAPELGQSNRCCQRCSSTIARLEKDLPVFRQWEKDFLNSGTPKTLNKLTPSTTPSSVDWGKTCPNPGPRASSGGETITQVTIRYPSQTLTRVCEPEEDPIVKCIVLKRWKEASGHIMKHPLLREEVQRRVIHLIRKESEVLCARKSNFMLWNCAPADIQPFSFDRLREDLARLAPFLLSIFDCISNGNNFAACTAAAIAIRGRAPQLAALSYWISTILLSGRAKKFVFNLLSQLSITTCHGRASKKRNQLILGCGAESSKFHSGPQATETELLHVSQDQKDLHPPATQIPALKDLLLSINKNKQTRTKEKRKVPFLKSDRIGLHEEVTVQVSCVLKLFDRCLRCNAEACSLLTRREGDVFYVTQQCWTCHLIKEWTSHAKMAAGQGQNAPGDKEAAEVEKSDGVEVVIQPGEDMDTEEEEEEEDDDDNDEEVEEDDDDEEEEVQIEEEEEQDAEGEEDLEEIEVEEERNEEEQETIEEPKEGNNQDVKEEEEDDEENPRGTKRKRMGNDEDFASPDDPKRASEG